MNADSFFLGSSAAAGTLPNAAGSQPLLLSAIDLAGMLNISTRTLWRLDSSAKLPSAVRVGSQKRWRCDEIQAWIHAGCPARTAWQWPRAAG